MMENMYKLKVSVIIPTYNRCQLIGKTLYSLLNQSYPETNYEIIVCDNNSTDKTVNVIKEYIKKYGDMRIRYLCEKRQGSHYARNSGALMAKGELLYFTDDDMIADYNLLNNLVDFMEKHSRVAIATGKVLPKWEIQPPKWIEKYCVNGWLSLLNRGKNNRISNKDVDVYSCHEMIRKDVFVKTGGFHLDFVGKELLGDGETGLNKDILNMGYLSAYVADAVIYHIIPEKRMTQKYLNDRFYGQGNADSYTEYRKNWFERKDLKLKYKGYLKAYIRECCRIIIQTFEKNSSLRFVIAKAYYYKARIIYDYRVVNERKFRALVVKNDWLK